MSFKNVTRTKTLKKKLIGVNEGRMTGKQP